METRISSKKDKEIIKQLWEDSCCYSPAFREWYFEKAFVPENTVLESDCGETVSGFTVTPQKLNLSGYEADAAYVSAMAMLPEYRTEENIKNQLSDVIVSVKNRDFLLSIVTPQNYRLLEQYGWRTAYDYKEYNIKPTDILPYPVKGRIARPRISSNTISILSDIYREFTADKNAYTVRSEDEWELILEDLYLNFGGKCVIFNDSENNPMGYMLYIIGDRKMGVYELAYKNRSAYESMMGFIRQHEGIVDSVAIKAPANDLAYLDFCDSRNAISLYRFMAARISDAEKALKIASAKLEEGFKIQVIDRFIEDNNKIFFLGNDFKVTDEEPDVITDIGTLTQLFMGYLSVDEAYKMNLVSGNVKLLKKVFGKKNNYISMLLL